MKTCLQWQVVVSSHLTIWARLWNNIHKHVQRFGIHWVNPHHEDPPRNTVWSLCICAIKIRVHKPQYWGCCDLCCITIVAHEFHYDNKVWKTGSPPVCATGPTRRKEALKCSIIHLLCVVVLCVTQTEQQSCVTAALHTNSVSGLFSPPSPLSLHTIYRWKAMQVEIFALTSQHHFIYHLSPIRPDLVAHCTSANCLLM